MTEKLTRSVPETAAALGVHPQTLRKAIDRGEVNVIRFGRRVLIPRAELRRLLGEDVDF